MMILHYIYYILHTTYYILHTTYHILHATHYLLHTTYYSCLHFTAAARLQCARPQAPRRKVRCAVSSQVPPLQPLSIEKSSGVAPVAVDPKASCRVESVFLPSGAEQFSTAEQGRTVAPNEVKGAELLAIEPACRAERVSFLEGVGGAVR